MLFFLVKRLNYKDRNLTIHQIYADRLADKRKLFHLTQDFENEIQNSDTLAFSGRQSVIINAGVEYFPVVRISHEDRQLHKCGTLVITAKVYPEEYSRALIVSDVMPEGASDGWHASKLERQIVRLHEWNDILYFRNFYDLKESEEIVVYLWNLNQDTFRVDTIEAGFYPF